MPPVLAQNYTRILLQMDRTPLPFNVDSITTYEGMPFSWIRKRFKSL